MKKYLLFLLLSYTINSVFGQEYFYYYNDTKKILTTQPYRLCITLNKGADIEGFTNEISNEGLSIIDYSSSLGCIFIDALNSDLYNQTYSLYLGNSDIESISPVFSTDSPNQMTACASRVAVKIHDRFSENDLNLILGKYGYSIYYKSSVDSSFYVISTNSRDGVSALVAANDLRNHDLFAAISPDFWHTATLYNGSPNDTMYGAQWNIHGENSGIKAHMAWEITKGHNSIVIAVLDTGVEMDHPELINGLVAGFNAVNDIIPAGWPSYTHNNDAHGTKCTGAIIAEHNNVMGLAGIAPKCKVMPIRMLAAGGIYLRNHYTSTTILYESFRYAIEHGASIISMSWAIGTPENLMELAIKEALLEGRNGKGCILVGAGGHRDLDSNRWRFPRDHDAVIAVGGSSKCGARQGAWQCWDWEEPSDFGEYLDIMAPSFDVPTTTIYGGYHLGRGTSIAAPQVAAVAGLMLSVNPDLTAEQVRYILESTAQKTGGYNYAPHPDHPNGTWHIEMGHGVVDAYQAVLAAQRLTTIADLYVKDASYDTGIEPNATPTSVESSPDIWVTNLNGDPVSTLTQGETYQVHVRVHNRTSQSFTGTADNTLLLRWAVGMSVPDWKTGWMTGNICGVSNHGIVMNQPLGAIPAHGSAVYTATWTAPSFPGNMTCGVTLDNLNLYMVAVAHDNGITVNLNAGNYAMDDFVRQNNNVAMKKFTLSNLDVYIEPLLPIFGAPASLAGGSSEADAELTWRSVDGTVLGTGETLDIVPTAATERYVLEGYSPSLDAYATDTLTLHPRLGAILAVAPNPVAGGQTEVSLRLAATLGGATLQVVNSLGHALLVQPVAPTADGSATATLNLQGIPTGQYQLRLAAGTTLVDIHTLIVQ